MGETRAAMQSNCTNDTALKCHVKVYYDMNMVAYIYEGLQPKNTSNDVMPYMW